MNKKYCVILNETERYELERLINTGKGAARKLLHARVLLKSDESEYGPGWNDSQTAESLEISIKTVSRIRERFVEEGIEEALNHKKPFRTRTKKMDGELEARVVALSCTSPPEGRRKWTMQLLADKLVELNYCESISDETVRVTLKKNEIKPWLKEQWCIPPEANAEFVCAMEDVLDVYQRPLDPQKPLVCLDETSKQQVRETRVPLPPKPGKPEVYDYEYERNGVSNLFMISAPIEGWRHVDVTDHRKKEDFARCIKDLVDFHFPDARKIVLVMDNLNTHKPASLYQAFTPQEAKRLMDKLEIHYTPKHGSWLDMAEIELGILQRQCLDRRIPDQKTLKEEVKKWEQRRNQQKATINWRFTTKDARIKLKRLYPIVEDKTR